MIIKEPVKESMKARRIGLTLVFESREEKECCVQSESHMDFLLIRIEMLF